MLLLSVPDPDGRVFADALACATGASVALHEERARRRRVQLRPLVDPQGADRHVLLSTHGGPTLRRTTKLCGGCQSVCATPGDHGAARVSAVVPYLAYARKRPPHAAARSARPASRRSWSEAVGVDRLAPCSRRTTWRRCRTPASPSRTSMRDAFDGAPSTARRRFARRFLVVASPDPGGCQACAVVAGGALEARLARNVGFASSTSGARSAAVGGGDLSLAT